MALRFDSMMGSAYDLSAADISILVYPSGLRVPIIVLYIAHDVSMISKSLFLTDVLSSMMSLFAIFGQIHDIDSKNLISFHNTASHKAVWSSHVSV